MDDGSRPPSARAAARVVLGVSGGIAAYKAVEVCRRLVDAGAHVAPVLTEDAQRFVGALTFSALASEPARTSLFDDAPTRSRTRGSARRPTSSSSRRRPPSCSASTPAGISDDLLTATLLATRAPVLVAPAMHTEMWEHPAVQENLATLRGRGVHVVEPETGRLAGGDVGAGRLAEPEAIVARRGVRARARGRPRRAARAGHRRRHPRADRPGALRRQPVVGEDGARGRRRGTRRGAAVTLVTTARRGGDPHVEVVRSRPPRTCTTRCSAALRRCRRRRDGRRGRRLPAQGDRAGEAEEARRRPRDRARADARHPRAPWARARRTSCSSGSPPRPSDVREHAAEKLRGEARRPHGRQRRVRARRRLRGRHEPGRPARLARGVEEPPLLDEGRAGGRDPRPDPTTGHADCGRRATRERS